MKNRIPRNFNRIVIIQKTDTNGGKVGDIWHVYKTLDGYQGLNKRTGEYFKLFASYLRNGDVVDLVQIV